jgi:hypothetical protein
MTQTAIQEHIEWLKATIEIAEEQYPILVNTLKLCLNDATHKLEMEKEQSIDFARECLNKAKDLDILTAFMNVEQYYNETFKSE